MAKLDIVHECGRFFVTRELVKMRAIYRVQENVGTHSVVRDTFDLRTAGLSRAIAKCDQRQAEWHDAGMCALAAKWAADDAAEYNRDLALRIKNNQVGSGMKLR